MSHQIAEEMRSSHAAQGRNPEAVLIPTSTFLRWIATLDSQPQAEGAGETAAMTVLRELVEGEDHWAPERDEAYQTAKHRARALVAGDEAASGGEGT